MKEFSLKNIFKSVVVAGLMIASAHAAVLTQDDKQRFIAWKETTFVSASPAAKAHMQDNFAFQLRHITDIQELMDAIINNPDINQAYIDEKLKPIYRAGQVAALANSSFSEELSTELLQLYFVIFEELYKISSPLAGSIDHIMKIILSDMSYNNKVYILGKQRKLLQELQEDYQFIADLLK